MFIPKSSNVERNLAAHAARGFGNLSKLIWKRKQEHDAQGSALAIIGPETISAAVVLLPLVTNFPQQVVPPRDI